MQCLRKILITVLFLSLVETATSLATSPLIKPIKEQEISYKSMKAFLHAIGKQESNNKYDTVSIHGFLGKYQFGQNTLKEIGIHTDTETFLRSPSLQEDAMLKLLRTNRRTLRNVIKKYEGTYIQGTRISESGILAAAHLGGVGSVLDYFYEGKGNLDKNGMSLKTYLRKFSGYKLKFGDLKKN